MKRTAIAGISLLSLISLSTLSARAADEPGAGRFSQLRGARGGDLIERLKAIARERGGNLPAEKKEVADNIKYDEWIDKTRNRTVPVKIFFPAQGSGPFPVVVFSHGLGGSREAAQYLGHYLSENGYICVHIQHAGSDTSVVRAGLANGPEGLMPTMNAAANGQNLVLRAQDVSFIIDELERRNANDKSLGGKLDLSKLAVAGHSFGAGTALAVSGQNYSLLGPGRSLGDDRVRAAIYLSPPANLRGRSLHDVYGHIKIPGLLMTGTEDNSPIGQTRAEDRRLPFDGIEAPHQYLINFTGGDHMIFNGRKHMKRPKDDMFQSVISKTCLEFLDAYLKGDNSARQWLDGKEALSFVSQAGQFERK